MIDPNTIQIPVSMTFDRWRQIGAALEDQPFKVAAPLISEINSQINAYMSTQANPSATNPVVTAETPSPAEQKA